MKERKSPPRRRCRSFDGGRIILPKKHTKYEKARIIGARALQIAMGAPTLIEVPPKVTDPIDIALLEFEKGAIPMTVLRRTSSERRAATR